MTASVSDSALNVNVVHPININVRILLLLFFLFSHQDKAAGVLLLLLLLLLSAVTHAPFHVPVLRPTSWPSARDCRDGEVN